MWHPIEPMVSARLAFPLLAACLSLVPACSDTPKQDAPRTFISLDFSGQSGFWDMPFPNDARLLPSGTADLSAFPNPASNAVAARLIELAAETTGFGTTSAIFFHVQGKLPDGELLGPTASILDDSPVVLMDVSDGPDRLRRYPVSARYMADAGPYGGESLLVVLPLQGVPLKPNTRYAVAILDHLKDAGGESLGPGPGMAPFIAGKQPEGMTLEVVEKHQMAIAALEQGGIALNRVVGLTVYTTGAPTDAHARVAKAMVEAPLPTPMVPLLRNEVFDGYCVYESTIEMPVYQGGEPPYTSAGGAWVFDAAGNPVLQRKELANFVLTVPRKAMPTTGFPVVIFSRTGAGGERPLVDRGVRDANGNVLAPGTGPAAVFAAAGYAAVSVDGPHGGLRNVTKGDEQFLVFNVGNPEALRDNVRQSAAELGLVAHVMGDVTVDAMDCPDVVAPSGMVQFDTTKLAIFGHSMGASIVPLTMAFEPQIRGMLLSGAGGSWLENLVHKQKPIPTKPLAETILGFAGSGYSISAYDPMLNLLQWAGESADVATYTPTIVQEPSGESRHVLMMQGIVDHYILPPIANTMSLSLGLDLAGDALDEKTEELSAYAPLGELLPLVGRQQIGLPAEGNVVAAGNASTGVVVQYGEDGVEDGHEVVFQTEAPKRAMRCFLESLASGTPRVPSAGAWMDPCD